MSENGHSNGHTNGHAGPLPQSDGHHDRGDARMRIGSIRRKLNEAIDDPTPLLEDLKFLREWRRKGRGQTAMMAAKAVMELRLKLLQLGFDIDDADDHRERLDNGEATENVNHQGGVTFVFEEAKPPAERVGLED